jgi:hypothetical protein
MANRLFERLAALPLSSENSLLAALPKFANQVPVACNPNIRLYKYCKGMSFGRHVDESCQVPGVGETRLTVLVYLSSCVGGATCFEHGVAFAPTAGAMLIHVHGTHCLLHEGQAVVTGIKYVLRTDLVYGER